MSALREVLGFLRVWYVWLTIVVLVLVVTGTLNAGDIAPLLREMVTTVKGMNPLAN